MKKLKKKLITVTFLAVLTLSASLFTTSNFAVQTALAQTAGSTGGGPQDGSDGKKKRCRPPQQCPTGSGTNNGRPASAETGGTDQNESSDWWSDFIDWLFGE